MKENTFPLMKSLILFCVKLRYDDILEVFKNTARIFNENETLELKYSKNRIYAYLISPNHNNIEIGYFDWKGKLHLSETYKRE